MIRVLLNLCLPTDRRADQKHDAPPRMASRPGQPQPPSILILLPPAAAGQVPGPPGELRV